MSKYITFVFCATTASISAFVSPLATTQRSRFLSKQQQQTQQPGSRLSVATAVNGDNTSTASASSSAAALFGDDYLAQIRLNVYEKARTVTSVCTSGTLCTVSVHEGIEGAPFGSFVDYVLDNQGNPVLLMNEMSMHTINVESAGPGALVTLFTQLGGSASGSAANAGKGASQDVSRCSLTGTLEKIPRNAEDMDSIRMRYSIAHLYADQVMDSPKFAFYRLIPKKIYFVGGFGVLAKWVDPEDYSAANPDILATEAAAIVQRINRDHQDDLQLTALHLLGLDSDKLVEMRMTTVDRLGMDLRVTSQMSSRRNKLQTDEFRIGFRIPVISVEDAKSEILKVFQEAWEKANGMDWGEDDHEAGSTVPILKIAADSLE